MRILHLLSQTQLTGSEVYAKQLADRQLADGHNVFFISDKLHVDVKAPFLSLPISSSKFLERKKTISILHAYLEKEKIDVIHCHSRAAVRHAYRARKGLPIAMVTTLHGRQHDSLSKKLFNIYGDYLIAVCENVQEATTKYFGINPWKIWLIRNPIDLTLAKANLSSKEIRVGIFGRSTGPKGERIEAILNECAEEWLTRYPQLHLEFGVNEIDRFSPSTLHNVAELKSKFQNRFELLSHQANLVKKLSTFHLVVASGRIAAEAIFQGTSVFALGEYTFHGLVNTSNLEVVLKSNFGDMGVDAMTGPFDLDQIKKDFERWMKNVPTPQNDFQKVQQEVSDEFSASKIYEKVMETYKAALFKRRINKKIPILMYHKIPDENIISRHRIFVQKNLFEKHLQFFKSQKFTTLSFSDIKKFWDLEENPQNFPQKPLLLTFDDGYLDNLTNAQPLLEKYNMKATIFLLSDHSITENTWDSDTGETPSKLMTLEQKKQLNPKVFEIGSHGFRHVHLPKVGEQAALQEMQISKKNLEKDFDRPVYVFAYPFGATNSRIADLCREAGYRFAVNTDQGGMEFSDNPFSLFRVNIFPEDDIQALWKKTSPWYRKYFYWRRKK